jgi:hypothetical protein
MEIHATFEQVLTKKLTGFKNKSDQHFVIANNNKVCPNPLFFITIAFNV